VFSLDFLTSTLQLLPQRMEEAYGLPNLHGERARMGGGATDRPAHLRLGVRNHFSCGSGKSEAAAPGLFMTPMTFLTCLRYLSPAVDI